MDHEQKVLSILLMRFDVKPRNGIKMAKEWLTKHPNDNWTTLLSFLKDERVIVADGVLKDVAKSNESNQQKKVRKYRGVEMPANSAKQQQHNQSSATKRQYRGIKY